MRISQHARGKEKLSDYGVNFKGLPQNKYGGFKTQKLRHYGGEFGAASPGRQLVGEELEREKAKWEPK